MQKIDEDISTVISLREEIPAAVLEPANPPAVHSRLYQTGVTGMAVSALIGIAAVLAFITVGWPTGPRRAVVALLVMAAIGFLAFATSAVFAAARETMTPPALERSPEPQAPDN